MAKYATSPPAPAAKPAAAARRLGMGEYKRKKSRAPRAGDEPPPPAVNEALDDLEHEVVRGLVKDLLHVLAPPPSSLPLPTFSLVRAATAKAAPASCAV